MMCSTFPKTSRGGGSGSGRGCGLGVGGRGGGLEILQTCYRNINMMNMSY